LPEKTPFFNNDDQKWLKKEIRKAKERAGIKPDNV
jgi:hypothetical protein